GFDLSSINSMPGVVGLTNHNTCFMNSIVQCLSNTDVLAEYFVLGQYKNDLKNCRKDRSKKYGTKGEVIELLASVVRSLWTVTYSQDMTKSLKDSISKYGAQYKGSNQHDSQEFMLWLFDKMHEDLNMQPVKKRSFTRRPSFRKSVSRKPSENGKGIDDVGAATKLAVDLSPTSFIQKLFQGHYRSSLTCPNCKKRSDTTDPFLCVSLPLKQRTTRPMYANVVYLPNKRRSGIGRRHMAGKTIKIGVSVPLDGKIIDLRQAVAAECGIHSRLLAFVDLQHDGFHKAYGDDYSLSDFPINNSSTTAANMSLYAFEMPPIAKMTAGTLPRNFASSHKKRATLGGKFGKEGKRFGRPLVFRASRDVLSTELQCMILNQMSDQLKNGVKHERMGSLFRLQVKDGIPNKSYLSQQAQQPLRLPTVDKALENCPAGGPLHIKLVAEWDTDTKFFISTFQVEVQDSVRLQKVLHQQPVTCTLEECFDLHTQVEELGADNAWLCPHCKKQQQGTVKKLSLLTLPDILVLHLKRFRVTDGRRTKLCTRVEFPVTGLNMSKHIFSGEMNGHISPQSPKSYNWNPAFASHLPEMVGPEDHLYDLYAVCNHFGNLNSGHYTACCSNPLNGKW
uniref:ubiquitinyl hydrolase 1 n=1 Tax=Ciona savignyi TaxID=51511 RepID=H2ZQE4_CIOSA